jgi:hypothetical protein
MDFEKAWPHVEHLYVYPQLLRRLHGILTLFFVNALFSNKCRYYTEFTVLHGVYYTECTKAFSKAFARVSSFLYIYLIKCALQ